VMRACERPPLRGIPGYTTDKNVSVDFNHDSRSSIFHVDQTKVLDLVLDQQFSFWLFAGFGAAGGCK